MSEPPLNDVPPAPASPAPGLAISEDGATLTGVLSLSAWGAAEALASAAPIAVQGHRVGPGEDPASGVYVSGSVADVTVGPYGLRLTGVEVRLAAPAAGEAVLTAEGTLQIDGAPALSARLTFHGSEVSPEADLVARPADAAVSVGALAALLGASPSVLLGAFPSPLHRALTQAPGLRLEELGLRLDAALAPLHARADVGLPDVAYDLAQGLPLTNLGARLDVASPGTPSAQPDVSLLGAVAFAGGHLQVVARGASATGWGLPGSPLTVGGLLRQLGVHASLPLGDVPLDALSVQLRGGKPHIHGLLASEAPLALPFRGRDLRVEHGYLRAGPTGAVVGGHVTLPELGTARVSYRLPDTLTVHATLTSVSLRRILAEYAGADLPLPPRFDLQVDRASALIRTAPEPGIALAVPLPNGLASVPGLEPLAALDALVGLDHAVLVLSTLDIQADAEGESGAEGLPELRALGVSGEIRRGLEVYGRLASAPTEGEQAGAFRILARYLGLDVDGGVLAQLRVSLPDPRTASRLVLPVASRINAATEVRGELGGTLVDGTSALMLSGELHTTIQGRRASFDVEAHVHPSGITVSGVSQGSGVPFDPLPVRVSNLRVHHGLAWSGVPTQGIAGTLDLAEVATSVALLFDTHNPARSLVAGSISELSVHRVAQWLAGQVDFPDSVDIVLHQIALRGLVVFATGPELAEALEAHDHARIARIFAEHGRPVPARAEQGLLVPGQEPGVWFFTDLAAMCHYRIVQDGEDVRVEASPQLYCAPQDTIIGGVSFPPGFRVAGALAYLTLRGELEVEVDPPYGVRAAAALDPISLYSTSFFSIMDDAGQAGPHLSLASYDDPHVRVSGRLRVLGQDVSGAYLDVTPDGLEIRAEQRVHALLELRLDLLMDKPDRLGGRIGFTVGFDRPLDFGPLGKVPVDTHIGGDVRLGYEEGRAYASVEGAFRLQELDIALPRIELDVDRHTLPTLADTLYVEATEAVRALISEPVRWLAWVREGAVEDVGDAAEDVGRVLATGFALPVAASVGALRAAGYSAGEVGRALGAGFDASVEGVTSAMLEVGYSANEAGQALREGFTDSAEVAAKALTAAGASATEVAVAIRGTFTDSAEVAAAALKAAGHAAEDVAAALRDGFEATVEEVAEALGSVFRLGRKAASAVLEGVGYATDEAAQAVRKVLRWFRLW